MRKEGEIYDGGRKQWRVESCRGRRRMRMEMMEKYMMKGGRRQKDKEEEKGRGWKGQTE